jgi:hypothetical protein
MPPFRISNGYSQQKKLRRTGSTLWNCIMVVWIKIKGNLIKVILQDLEEVLRQPLFCNTFPTPYGSLIGDNFVVYVYLPKGVLSNRRSLEPDCQNVRSLGRHTYSKKLTKDVCY